MKYTGKFLYSVDKTLEHEGLFSNSEYDPGGKTKFGITERVFNAYASHVESNTVEDLTKNDAKKIYYKEFWLRLNLENIQDWYIASEYFDFAINSGPKNCSISFQIMLNDIFDCSLDVDGMIGNKTITAINTYSNKYAENMSGWINFYRGRSLRRSALNENWIHHKKGWGLRINKQYDKNIDKSYWNTQAIS